MSCRHERAGPRDRPAHLHLRGGSDGRYAFNYDQLNRLASANTATQKVNSVYNGLGLRTRKTVSLYSDGLPPMMVQSAGAGAKTDAAAAAAATGTWTTTRNLQFVYDTEGRLLGEYNSIGGSSQETVWFNGQPVATLINGVLHYIHADHLGTPRSIVRASTGVELWRWDSDPFGTSSASAPNPGAGTITYNLRFPGQYLDTETGLHYNGMRDYDPRTGRYVQADPIGLKGGLARYTYVGGNPVSFVDADGLRQASPPLPGDAGAPSRLTGPMDCSCIPVAGGLSTPSAGNIAAGSMAVGAGAGAVAGGVAGTAAGVREGAKLGIIAGLAVADAAGCGAVAGATVGGAVGALAGVAIVGGIALFSGPSSNCTCVPR